MSLLIWSNQYAIGHNVIDEAHQALFGLINLFYQHWHQSENRHEVAQLLNQLITYAQKHFQEEEALMAKAHYPELVLHQHAHEGLVRAIFSLHQSYVDQTLHVDTDMMRFLKSWLADHIQSMDFRFRDFLHEQAKVL